MSKSGFLCVMLLLVCAAYSNGTSQDARKDHNDKPQAQKRESLTSEKMTAILEGYDKRVRAGTEENGPLKVDIEIYIISVYDIDERMNEFTLELYLRQYWRDSRLSMKKYNISSYVFLPEDFVKKLWLPTTYFVMSKRAVTHKVTTDNILVRIDKDGNIFYSQRLSITSTCILDLRLFPHDTQKCNLTVESYSYQTTDCIYSWSNRYGATEGVEHGNKNYLDLPAFALGDIKTTTKTNEYSIGNHTSLIAVFTFKRRIGYFLIETWIPSSIVVAISWVSFWISPKAAPARVALGITTILTMVTISSSARQSLPKVSYVKALDWFLLACLLFVFGSLLEYAVIQFSLNNIPNRFKDEEKDQEISIHVDGKSDDPLIDKEKNCIQKNLSKCKLRRENSPRSEADQEGKGLHYRKTIKGNLSDSLIVRNNIDEYARKGFPLSYIIFNAIYWSCMLCMEQ